MLMKFSGESILPGGTLVCRRSDKLALRLKWRVLCDVLVRRFEGMRH